MGYEQSHFKALPEQTIKLGTVNNEEKNPPIEEADAVAKEKEKKIQTLVQEFSERISQTTISESQKAEVIEVFRQVLENLEEEQKLNPLTNSEKQILDLIQQGYNNQQIADKLFVSRETVRWHIRNLNAKLGVTTRKNKNQHHNPQSMSASV